MSEVTQGAGCSCGSPNPTEFQDDDEARQNEQHQCHKTAPTSTNTGTPKKKGRKIIVEMSKATATKMSNATGITLWSCDVCEVAKFEDYDAACLHEEKCLEMTNNEEVNKTAAAFFLVPHLFMPLPKKDDKKGRTLIVEMSKATAVEMSNATGITLWSCNVCKEAKFEDYNAACEHEKQCQGVARNKESQTKTGSPQPTEKEASRNKQTDKHTKRIVDNDNGTNSDNSTSEEEWTDQEMSRNKNTNIHTKRNDKNDNGIDNNSSTGEEEWSSEEEEWTDTSSKRRKSAKIVTPRKRRTIVAAAATGEEVLGIEDSSDEEQNLNRTTRAEPEIIDVDQLPSPISSPVAAAATAPDDDEEIEVWGGASDDDDVVEVVNPSSTAQNQGSVLDDSDNEVVEVVNPTPASQKHGSVLDDYGANHSNSNDQGEPNEDQELQVLKSTGPLAFADFPHAREHCLIKPMRYDAGQYCPKCYCYVCDTLVAECKQWTEHCLAESTNKEWRTAREMKRELDERCASMLASRNQVSTETAELPSNVETNDLLSGSWQDEDWGLRLALLDDPDPRNTGTWEQAYAASPSSLAVPTNHEQPQSKRGYKSTLQKLREKRRSRAKSKRRRALDNIFLR